MDNQRLISPLLIIWCLTVASPRFLPMSFLSAIHTPVTPCFHTSASICYIIRLHSYLSLWPICSSFHTAGTHSLYNHSDTTYAYIQRFFFFLSKGMALHTYKSGSNFVTVHTKLTQGRVMSLITPPPPYTEMLLLYPILCHCCSIFIWNVDVDISSHFHHKKKKMLPLVWSLTIILHI